MILDKVNYPEDIRKLNIIEKKELAKELREKIVNTVSNTGGHLASNLGVVELTIALHSVFNTPIDKIVWDVGHQTYIHKILTGRKNKLDSLRKIDGLAGFPKTTESMYDVVNTGHSSTSISIASGIARARDIKEENHKVIAVIGDGALTGGMALEALNDVGSSNTNMLVILNDNEMSISKNVGGISMLLSKLRTKSIYVNTSIKGKKTIAKLPFVGKKIVKLVQKTKRGIKQLVIPKMYFEDIGFRYLGPVDGHNLDKLEEILKICKEQEGPILLHVLTKKGKGYKPAEDNPDTFHSTSKFDIETGEKLKKSGKDYSKIFGETLVEIAKDNKKIVAITAAMKDGTGLTEFAKKYPKRFFDVGIAEQHAVGLAAGLASSGMIPVVPLYSSFMQRAYDQLVHDVALPNLPVIICADRAGIVGNDGETHQGLLDMSFTNTIPNFTIMAPKDFNEMTNMLKFAVNLKAPVLLRYPRGGEEISFEKSEEIILGKPEIIDAGKDICIMAIGKMVSKAKNIRNNCLKYKLDIGVVNARFLKPLKEEYIVDIIKKYKTIITIEDGTIVGGLGAKIQEIIEENKLKQNIIKFAYPDEFIKHGDVKDIEERYGLSEENIENIILNYLENSDYSIIEKIKRGNGCLKIIKEKKELMKKANC